MREENEHGAFSSLAIEHYITSTFSTREYNIWNEDEHINITVMNFCVGSSNVPRHGRLLSIYSESKKQTRP